MEVIRSVHSGPLPAYQSTNPGALRGEENPVT